MDEKHTEALLSSTKEHMVTIPNDVQQLTIKDCVVFFGKGHRRYLKPPCFRCWNALTIILLTAVVGIVLLPAFYYLTKLVSISGTTDSGYYVSFNRDVLDPLAATMNNVERMTGSLPNVFSRNKLSSTASEADNTILYYSHDPGYSLKDFFQFTSVYITRGYETTLSFLMQNNQSSTYLDDVSVNTSYGSELIINGGFDNDTYGWQGLSYSSYCYSSYRFPSSSPCVVISSGTPKVISQTFSTTPGSVLYISFKLHWNSYGSGILNKVTIYS